eukprot:CAMPEP_0178387236 /NCGR_PEP_ID=MMETSP0689_2-20121128/8970_1 /TAXON_ID=160604 /ORGANISM="Amphidinium massartii, Strain CS-259" /LENGTH=334 /DNA_ID=CAMNT_0020007595 /DNA_START=54 /DNA_END=1055 /DNA_ORIENTATION=+
MGCVLAPDGQAHSEAGKPHQHLQVEHLRRAMAAAAATRSQKAMRTFPVVLHRQDMQGPTEMQVGLRKRGGIEVGTLDNKTLLITALHPALVSKHNRIHPTSPILVGDLIESVNGVCGDVEAMQQELNSPKDVLELMVCACEPSAASSASPSRRRVPPDAEEVIVEIKNSQLGCLGLEVENVDGRVLQVMGIVQGYAQEHNEDVLLHNEALCEKAILPGDFIIAVQDEQALLAGDARQLHASLAKLGCGLLTLRRARSSIGGMSDNEQMRSSESAAKGDDESATETTKDPTDDDFMEALASAKPSECGESTPGSMSRRRSAGPSVTTGLFSFCYS